MPVSFQLTHSAFIFAVTVYACLVRVGVCVCITHFIIEVKGKQESLHTPWNWHTRKQAHLYKNLLTTTTTTTIKLEMASRHFILFHVRLFVFTFFPYYTVSLLPFYFTLLILNQLSFIYSWKNIPKGFFFGSNIITFLVLSLCDHWFSPFYLLLLLHSI